MDTPEAYVSMVEPVMVAPAATPLPNRRPPVGLALLAHADPEGQKVVTPAAGQHCTNSCDHIAKFADQGP
jgi:hypothetical protein